MEITASTEFASSADAIWALLENFAAIERWWPKEGNIRIEKVECEGHGIGLTRHIYNVGMEKPVSERLDFIDPQQRTLILSIVGERQGGITAYVAIAKLLSTGPNSCRMNYQAYVTTVPGKEQHIEKNIRFTWEVMFSGLRQAAT